MLFEKFFSRCTNTDINCDISKSHKHCDLCDKTFDTPYHCKRHFSQSHASRAILHEGSYCFPCKKSHKSEGNSAKAHYHCPSCDATVVNKAPFLTHLRSHIKKERDSKDTKVEQHEEVQNEDLPLQAPGESSEEMEEIPKENVADKATTQFRKNIAEKTKCPICSKMMHVKSITRHCREIHEREMPSSTCVDEQQGIFLIRNSSKGGVGYPIHVRKVMGGGKTVAACEVTDCMDTMAVAWRIGISTAECHHLVNVGKNPIFPEKICLNREVLNDLSKTGTYRLLTDERIESCRHVQALAEKKQVPCIVPMEDGKRFLHFSVFHEEVNYFSRFGRVVVSADLHKGTLDCRCCRRKLTCIHKCLVFWYLHQKYMFDAFRGADLHEQRLTSSKESNTAEQVHAPKNVYPPLEPQILGKMCDYLKQQKSVPMDWSEVKALTALPSKKFIPVETHCHYCKLKLDSSIRITNRAVVLTMRELYSGVETYFKKCPNCGVCYRYQEHVHGLHNFNDNFIIALDVCKFLRESLQQHLPIGSIVNVLRNQLNKPINSQTVVEAYLHFDSMSSHAYNYHCALCGFHPTTLIMDLNKKVAFDCPQSYLELPDDYDTQEADIVDSDNFWRKVEMSMIIRGFPNRVVPDFKIRPSLLFWAPFIGKQTRKSSLLFNTEHRKVKKNRRRTGSRLSRNN